MLTCDIEFQNSLLKRTIPRGSAFSKLMHECLRSEKRSLCMNSSVIWRNIPERLEPDVTVPGACLGDDKTKAGCVPAQGGCGDALLRRIPSYLTYKPLLYRHFMVKTKCFLDQRRSKNSETRTPANAFRIGNSPSGNLCSLPLL